jgi:hypothetical protein
LDPGREVLRGVVVVSRIAIRDAARLLSRVEIWGLDLHPRVEIVSTLETIPKPLPGLYPRSSANCCQVEERWTCPGSAS